MRVAVGSQNPVKERAAEDAIAALEDATVEPVAVASGVSEQPVGHEETLTGAETRAENALAAGSFDVGVGIEGGVADLDATEDAPAELSLIMWAAVTDGTRMGRGAGPTILLPDRIARRVRDGEELGPVMDDEFDMTNVKENQGAAGLLTGGATSRREALKVAVAGALGPVLTDAYD